MVQQGLYDPQNLTHRYGYKGTDLLDIVLHMCMNHCLRVPWNNLR